jgi:TatD DNase family protein
MSDTPNNLERRPTLIDSHCHLTDKSLRGQVEQVLTHARTAGVRRCVTVSGNLDDARACTELAARFEPVYAAVGIHPHEAADAPADYLDRLRELAAADKVVAIGEVGLDYFYDHSPRQVQRVRFAEQVALAAELGMPLIVHCRDAFADAFAILDEQGKKGVRSRLPERPEGCCAQTTPDPFFPVRGVCHCFTGGAEEAAGVLARGLFISFGGMITFASHRLDGLRQVALEVPVDRLLAETDSPYLSPEPHRGKWPNEPARVVHSVEFLAKLYGLRFEDLARITTANAEMLFGLGGRDAYRRIVYSIRDSLYVNLTNRCSNQCTFCPRSSAPWVKGHYLALEAEPSAADVIAALSAHRLADWREVVFCGFGEPMLRLDVLKEVAAFVRGAGLPVRINTNGQGNLIHGRDITAELAPLVGTVSVSLNSADPAQYGELCRSEFGERAYEGILDFIRRAKAAGIRVVVTAVTVPGVDMDAVGRLAAELGVEFRPRKYQELG